MKKLVIIFTMIIVANVTGFGPTVCNAQLGEAAPLPEIKKSTGPTLEETTKWITEKIASFKPVQHNSTELINFKASFDDCEMTFTRENPNPYLIRLDIHYCKLQDMDESRIKATRYTDISHVYLKSLGDLEVVKTLILHDVTLKDKEIIDAFPVKGDITGTLRGNPQYGRFVMGGKEISWVKYLTDSFDFAIKEHDDAESMVNALKHAIKLCTQKAVDEKAARPPKKKELF